MTSTGEAMLRSGVSGQIVMVGAAVPQDIMDVLMQADRCPQVQTHKLSWAVVRGIESTGEVVDLISTVAVSDYPQSDWLWSGYRKWDRGNGSDNRLVPFINVLGFKQLTRFLGCLTMLLRWAGAHRGQSRHVLLYGVISAHLYAVRCVRLLFSLNTTVLITDLPGLATSQEPWWRRMLRPIDRYMVHRAVEAADGLIVLTKQIAKDFAPKVPAIVVEGIVSVESEELAETMPSRRSDRQREFVVMYAGGLQRIYGIPLLLDAFRELPGEHFRLWLFGRGDMEGDIHRRAEEDPRIYFPGLIAPEEVFRRSQQATVLVNPRPSRERFTPYSFPSKLLEYMVSGRPVITTRLPGIPEDYDPYVLWLEQETPEELAALLRQLRERPPEQLDNLGHRARDYVLQEKNHRRQGRRIVEFIEHINSLGERRS